MDYPAVLQVDPERKECMCEACLTRLVKMEIETYVAQITPESATENRAKDLPKTATLREEIDYYIENGLYVFTSWFHLKRGACCKNGCRHCPYGFKK